MSFSGSHSRDNSISGNYTYISKNGWHHNFKGGSSQIENLSTQNTKKDLDGTKNLSLNYNSAKYLNDSTKLKFTGYAEKLIVVMTVGTMKMQGPIILCMQFSLI